MGTGTTFVPVQLSTMNLSNRSLLLLLTTGVGKMCIKSVVYHVQYVLYIPLFFTCWQVYRDNSVTTSITCHRLLTL